MKAAQKAMIYKDIKEVLGSTQMLVPMIVVPVVMVVILPLMLLIGAKFGATGINGMDQMVKIFGAKIHSQTNAQILIEIGLNYMFPVFFLLIPVMCSSILGASSFIGEKERKTMESLLYTPLKIQELFTAKVIGTAIPAYAVTLLSVFVFGIVMDVGGWFYFHKLIFPNIKWIILIIGVAPAVTLLGINFMVLVSAKANTFQEAQQMSALIILPIIFLLIGQMTGLFMLSEVILLIVGAVIYIVDYFLIKNATKKFTAEKLV
ncbi:MAG TPA: ABC transporter permease [Bacillota bacterium]|nr:ABC transporter permease [Bacillota bacterium]